MNCVYKGRESRLGRLFGLSLFLLLLISEAFGQCPGGTVGMPTGNLVHWIRPEQSSCTTTGCNITGAIAQVGPNLVSLKGAATATYQPSGVNYNGTIKLTNGQVAFRRVTPSVVARMSIFGMIKHDPLSFGNTNQNNWFNAQAVLSCDSTIAGEADFGIVMRQGNLRYGHDGSDNYVPGISAAITPSTPTMYTVTKVDSSNVVANDVNLFLNGVASGSGNSLSGSVGNFQRFYIGRAQNDHVQSQWDGDIGDVIVFNSLLGPTQRRRVEAYVAIKYGITLTQDYLSHDGVSTVYAVSGYGNDIVGIGFVTQELLHQRVSQSINATNSIKIWNGTGASPTVNTSIGATDLTTDNSYEIIGHDGQGVSFSRTAGTATVPNMLGRTYKVTETGTVGTVTIFFANSLFVNNGAGQYLAYSNQPGVGIPTAFVPLVAAGPGYTAQVDFPAGTSYFTITQGNSIKGPAGVSTGLAAWYMAERGVNTPGGVTAWSDLSGFGRTLNNSGAASNVRKWKSNNVGWTRFISSRLTTNVFGTSGSFIGQTIITAAQGFNGGTGDGLMGFDVPGACGLLSDLSGQIQLGGGGTSWSNSGGSLQQNATNITVATAPVNVWSVLTSRRSGAIGASSFKIGPYASTTNFDSVRIGEVAVYSTVLGPGEQDRLESYMAIKYGITLNGRYYASDWNGTAGTVLYTPAAYNKEIIGIGRDDNAGLTKRQSKSSDKNDVLSISLGGTAANDSLNTAAFTADISYLITGHDGLGVTCFSTNNIVTPSEPRDHIRLERTWKMIKTGLLAGSTVEFQVDVANPNADIAALPPTSTNYYLYVSTDSLFRSGVGIYQLSFSANRWKTSLTNVQIPSGRSFFTIGTKLNKASFDKPSVCYGATITNYGSNLADANVCTMMSFDNGGAFLYKTMRAGAIAPHSFINISDLPGGCIDTIRWTVPINLPVGYYKVQIDDSIAGVGACDSAIFGLPTYGLGKGLLDSLRISASEVAALTWGTPLDTVFCVGEPSLTAVKGTGCTLGSIQFVSSNNPLVTNLTWVNLLIADTVFSSSSFATILVHAGDTGSHVIRFVTRGGTPCKDTLVYRFRIKPSITTSVSYTGSPYCGGDTAVHLPTLGTTIANSKFSSSPILNPMQLDTLTGQPYIPNILVPGTYVITYRPPTGQCALPSSTSITVVAATRADFNYTDDHYCKNGGVVGPWIANRPNTGFFEVAPGSPGLAASINLNAATGNIDLGLSTADTFYIRYNVNAPGCTYNTLDTVIIDVAPNANFLINTIDTICIGLGTRATTYFPGGTFSSIGNYFNITVPDSFTATTPGGPFYLQYKLSNAFCTDSSQHQIWVNGQQSATIQYDSLDYCTNESDPFPVFVSGNAGGTFLSTPGIIINSATGAIDVSASAAGTYVISYKTPDPTCPDTILVGSIDVHNISAAAFTLVPDSICENSGIVAINTVPANNNSFSVWSGSTQVANAISGPSSIDTDTLRPGGPYEIRNIRTNAFCADTAYDYLVVNPLDLADIQFSPPVICIGDFNPYPQILGDGGGFFQAITPGITVDPDTGIVTIDSVGFYEVRYTTVGTCPSKDSAIVEVRLKIPADFTYPLLKFCSSFPDSILPDFIASPGQGLFSSDTSVTIDSLTGYIDLSLTSSGTHNITYTIIQTGACADLDVVTLTIVAPDTVTSISLPVDSFCWRASDIVQVVVTGTQGGLFSSDPGLVFSNADSGIVSLTGSDPNAFLPHTITYTLPTVCDEDQFSTNIWIFPRENPYFAYVTNAFCNRSTNPLPDTIATPGGTFSLFPPTSLVIQINSGTGELQLDDNTGQGPVAVQYVTPGTCSDTLLFPIRISNRPAGTDIDVKPDTVVCEGYTLEVRASGGYFQYFYLGNNPIPIDTGDVHVFANLRDNDTLRVEFYTDLGCVVDTTVTIDVLPIPDQQVLNNPTIINSVDPFLVEMAPITSDSTYFIWYVLNPIGGIDFPLVSDRSVGTVGVGQSTIIDVPFTMSNGFVPAQFTFLVEPWSKGCRGPADTIYVRVNPEDLAIFVPQVMTPDGNGQNETWLVQWKDGINPADYTILLYNEAGAKVYTMEGLTSDWGGADLPDGVYWYTLLDAKGGLVEAAGLTIRRK